MSAAAFVDHGDFGPGFIELHLQIRAEYLKLRPEDVGQLDDEAHFLGFSKNKWRTLGERDRAQFAAAGRDRMRQEALGAAGEMMGSVSFGPKAAFAKKSNPPSDATRAHQILVEKLGRKPSLQKQLQLAQDLNRKIDAKTGELDQLDRRTVELEVVTKNYEQSAKLMKELQVWTKEWAKMQVHADNYAEKQEVAWKRQRLNKEISDLENRPDYRKEEDLEVVRAELSEIEALTASLKEVVQQGQDSDLNRCCSVCFETPRETFSCDKCYNWVCGSCNAKLASCPSCRVDLVANPMKRNKGIERMLLKMQ